MARLFIATICIGIFVLTISVLVDAYPATIIPPTDPVPTHVTLFLLGTGLSAMAFWGKRLKNAE